MSYYVLADLSFKDLNFASQPCYILIDLFLVLVGEMVKLSFELLDAAPEFLESRGILVSICAFDYGLIGIGFLNPKNNHE